MAQSFNCLHYHIVFSTKHREPTIPPTSQDRLYSYIGGTLRSEKCVLLAAGGIADHVHLLCRLTQQHAVADVVRVIKANSSKWVRETGEISAWGGWQSGYGAFTASYSQLANIVRYIAKQESHHRKLTFQDEYREILRRHGLEWNEAYLWD